MPRYKITIEYDGTNFGGWQKQDNAESIQENIEKAVYSLAQEQALVYGSGRTDSGVHAIAQVAHFDLIKEFKPLTIINALNFFLKKKPISITDCQIVDGEFHARFSAKKRHYSYFILNRNAPLAIDKNHQWHVREPLDIRLMQQATHIFEGTNDFSSFRTAQCQAKSPIKTLDLIIISKQNDIIRIDLSAESFLHRMVRNIVGCLRMIGNKRWQEKDLITFRDAKTTDQHRYTAPPDGLFLTRIEYWELTDVRASPHDQVDRRFHP